jgi:5-methylcytosine-specific restriction enzyme subunit McrC
LDKGYVAFVEETRSPRDRLLVDKVVKQQTLQRGAVICDYDQLTVDVMHNQIVKTTALTLSQVANLSPSNAHELRRLGRRMGDISAIRINTRQFGRVQFARNTWQYVPLLRLCEMIHHALLPAPEGRGRSLWTFLKTKRECP